MRAIHSLLAAAALVLVAPPGTAQAGSSADLFIRMQTEPPARLIQHCRAKAPDTQDELVAEFEDFRTRFAEAAAPLAARMPADVPPDVYATLERFIVETGDRQLQAISQLDPNAYCPWLARSLRSATVERLRASLQSAIERYNELAKGTSQAPVQR